ncbi:hypothetical protein ACU21_03675 [Actinobaculum suis]|nr:hypothetical protein ACU21_03675 [Actinobaculum suis]
MAAPGYFFEFSVSGMDIYNDAQTGAFEHAPDNFTYLCGTRDSQGIISVYAEGISAVQAVQEAYAFVRTVTPSIHVERLLPDLVNTSAIGETYGVSRQAVRKWATSRASEFPQPHGVVPNGQIESAVWLQGDVEEWLLTHRAQKEYIDPEDPRGLTTAQYLAANAFIFEQESAAAKSAAAKPAAATA